MNSQHRNWLESASSRSLLLMVTFMFVMALVSYVAFAPGGATWSGVLRCFVGVLPFLGLVGVHAILSRQ